jgi:serine/threonine protein phosphatase PrpC
MTENIGTLQNKLEPQNTANNKLIDISPSINNNTNNINTTNTPTQKNQAVYNSGVTSKPPKNTENSQFIKFTSWLKVSATVEQGNKRKTMEDRIVISSFQFKHKYYRWCVLLDGHGGSEVCDYVKDHFLEVFAHFVIKSNSCNTRKIIKDTCVELDRRVQNEKSGTTLSLVLFVENTERHKLDLWVANLGDSSVYGIQKSPEKYDVRKLSLDHNVKLESERKRIEQVAEYKIEDGYVVLKNGQGLNLTRALGDHEFGQDILPIPTIKHVKTPYSTILMASDGVYDFVSGKTLWQKLNNPKEQRAWRESAYRLNYWRNQTFPQHDNTSLVVIFVDYEKFKLTKKEKTE